MFKAQRGVSYVGLMIILLILGLLVKIVCSIGFVYWDDYVINKQIVSVLKESDSSMTPTQLNSKMNSRLDMNDIESVKFENIAQISKTDNDIIISKHYEIRKHWLSNIDLVLTFEKNFDQRTIQVK